jgi:hypothetical protein
LIAEHFNSNTNGSYCIPGDWGQLEHFLLQTALGAVKQLGRYMDQKAVAREEALQRAEQS